MALFQSHFFANTLGLMTRAQVLLPDRPDPTRPIPTLYLLHGLSDDETIWMRRTAIELYATQYYLAIVMPDGDRSYYANLPNGSRYFDYITHELPEVMESYFPLAKDRANRFVGGLSMGGMGAFTAAFARPEYYAAVAGLSSVTDITWFRSVTPDLYDANLGEAGAAPKPPCELFQAAAEVAKLPEADRPRIFQYCGVGDMLFADNVRFRDHLRALGFDPHWEEGPGGHSWANWNERIQNVLKWLPLSENIKKTGAIGI